MLNYISVSLISGIVFGVLDGVVNANPYAQRLFEVYKPIAKTSINVPLGLGIDLLYGFVLTGLFMLLYPSLPGHTGLIKGLSFGVMVWFLRVVMYGLSHLMMFEVSMGTLLYILGSGLVEMVLLGLLIGLAVRV